MLSNVNVEDAVIYGKQEHILCCKATDAQNVQNQELVLWNNLSELLLKKQQIMKYYPEIEKL